MGSGESEDSVWAERVRAFQSRGAAQAREWNRRRALGLPLSDGTSETPAERQARREDAQVRMLLSRRSQGLPDRMDPEVLRAAAYYMSMCGILTGTKPTRDAPPVPPKGSCSPLPTET